MSAPTVMRPCEFRPYRDGDEAAILALFEAAFRRPLSLRFWQWRFKGNPAGGPLIELAWDGDTLAAHYAVSPVIVDFDGTPKPTALSLTTMTHPDYRGQGLFIKLAQTLYERMRQTGYALVWGFPNDQSHRGFIRDLAWRDIAEVPMLKLAWDGAAKPIDHPHVAETTDVGWADELWQQAGSKYRVAVRRDAAYLRWRLLEHPDNRYRIFTYRDGDRVAGYAATKQYEDGVDIVDLVGPTAAIARELMGAALDVATAAGSHALNCWVPLRDANHLELEKLGFRNAAPITYLGGLPLAEDGGSSVQVASWHYSMIDSDVF